MQLKSIYLKVEIKSGNVIVSAKGGRLRENTFLFPYNYYNIFRNHVLIDLCFLLLKWHYKMSPRY